MLQTSRWSPLLAQTARDESGQDLIEYAMLIAFLALAVAAFLPPTLAPAISGIFSKITTILARA
ncbi:MAG: Flp family type IVb pilin [Bryobacteraceae bacterium]